LQNFQIKILYFARARYNYLYASKTQFLYFSFAFYLFRHNTPVPFTVGYQQLLSHKGPCQYASIPKLLAMRAIIFCNYFLSGQLPAYVRQKLA